MEPHDDLRRRPRARAGSARPSPLAQVMRAGICVQGLRVPVASSGPSYSHLPPPTHSACGCDGPERCTSPFH
eukprot:6469703-Prymnesium_polylepis.1